MATDLFVVPTITFRLLFVLVILAHDRRRIVHVAVTEHPTAAWTAQQLRNVFSENETPRYLLLGRDHRFSSLSGCVSTISWTPCALSSLITGVLVAGATESGKGGKAHPQSPTVTLVELAIVGHARRMCVSSGHVTTLDPNSRRHFSVPRLAHPADQWVRTRPNLFHRPNGCRACPVARVDAAIAKAPGY
jgi:hypothetical protein